MDAIVVEQDRCNLCGLCIPVCVRRILEEGDEAARVTDQALCILCGHCKAVCPEDAFRMPSLDSKEFEPIPKKEGIPGAEPLMAAFRSRRSTRIFKKDSVEREKLEKIVEAGRFAPTGGNRQPLRYIVIQTPEKLQQIRTMTINALVDQASQIERAIQRHRETGESLPETYQVRQVYINIWREMGGLLKQGIDRLFYHAPALIVCHVNPAASTFPEVDAGLSAMQMVLMAEALGLGTCFCGFFVFAAEASSDLREALNIPDGHRVPLSFMVGHPDVNFLRLVSRNPARIEWL